MSDAASLSRPQASLPALIAGTPRPILALAGLLAVQLALAALLAVSGPDRSRPPAGAPVFAFDPAAVDAITVAAPAMAASGGAGGDDARDIARLRRGETGWVLPDLFDFPADDAQVATLLERLAGLEAGWAVAQTPAARRRFEVTDAQFQRRITLAQGDTTLGALFLGTSPVFRQIHARADGEDAIYVVDFAAYEAPAQDRDWMDRDALALEEADIQSIAFSEFMLVRRAREAADLSEGAPGDGIADRGSSAGAFTLADARAEETVDDAAVRRLVSAVARPRFDTVVGRADAAPPEDAARATITVSLSDGSVRRYVLAAAPAAPSSAATTPDEPDAPNNEAAADDDEAATLLIASDQDFVFRLEGFAADSLLNARRADLIAPPAEAERDGAADPTAADPLLATPPPE